MSDRLLDLFCGEGGAAEGYKRAGFEVYGIDQEWQENYAGDDFTEYEAMEFLAWAILAGAWEDEYGWTFDAIHASPPCQAHTGMSNRWRGKGGKADSHKNLIVETRWLLDATGLPYVIENVPGARAFLDQPVVLTGEMFGLRVHRPRLFETNWPILVPPKPPPAPDTVGVYGKAHDGRLLWKRADGTEQHAAASLEEAREAMGMPWASWRGLAEAIPPAYTELIGTQLMAIVRAKVAA